MLILDGLDEHALGTNQDVLKIIRGEKLLSCSIIVTSRPHSTKQIEKYFPVILRVEGFTYNKAEQFASKILSDNQKVAAVLNFNPAGLRDDVSRHICPILLSFLCLLVREDEIDLSTTNMHVREIYFRMVRCLYKKFTIRKGIEFSRKGFYRMTMLIGQLAFDTLLSGNPLLQRSHVMSLIGQDAFDYGLLIGHEDFRLLRDETADIFITFPHRSLQEFLGAFFFIWKTEKKGRSISTFMLDKSPIFLTNPLFFQFSLWFLSSDKKYQICKNPSLVYEDLTNYSTDLLNGEHLDTKHIAQKYRAFHIADQKSLKTEDELRLRFLRDILAKCDLVSHLSVKSPEELAWLLTSYPLKTLKFIACGHTEIHLSQLHKTQVGVKSGKYTSLDLNALLKHLAMDGLSVHLDVQLDNLSEPLIDECGIDLKTFQMDCRLPWEKPLRQYWEHRHLTHLRIEDYAITDYHRKTPIAKQLSEVVKKGGLHCLTYLNLSECISMGGTLHFLFETLLPELQQLNLVNTRLRAGDLRALCLACNGKRRTLPNLTSPCLSLPYDLETQSVSDNLFALPWPCLKSLYQFYSEAYFLYEDYSLFHAFKQNKLPNLSCLGIQYHRAVPIQPMHIMHDIENLLVHYCVLTDEFEDIFTTVSRLNIRSCKGATRLFSHLLHPGSLLLTTLVLNDCELTSQDLSNLAQAAEEGRLPELKHLDLSYNRMTGDALMSLFDTSCSWNQLLSLDIGNNLLGRSDITCAFMKKVETNGLLGSLHKLGIDDYPFWGDNLA